MHASLTIGSVLPPTPPERFAAMGGTGSPRVGISPPKALNSSVCARMSRLSPLFSAPNLWISGRGFGSRTAMAYACPTGRTQILGGTQNGEESVEEGQEAVRREDPWPRSDTRRARPGRLTQRVREFSRAIPGGDGPLFLSRGSDQRTAQLPLEQPPGSPDFPGLFPAFLQQDPVSTARDVVICDAGGGNGAPQG